MTSATAPIGTALDGIGHVLRDRRLSVPPYQRAYSWEDEQVSDFWWDLRAAFPSKASQYFLGTVVLRPGHDQATIIIDGQQRLATAALLFAAIRNEFLRRDDPDRAQVVERDYLAVLDVRSASVVPRMTLNPEDQEEFGQAALGPAAEPDPGPPATDLSRIRRALSFFEERVGEEAKAAGSHWAELLFRWVDFLEHRARVITVEVATEADAFLVFETLNAHGRDLTVADLLKNYLFGIAREDLEAAQSAWVTALEALEASADEAVFKSFVRHLWSAAHGATRERDLYSRMKASISSNRAALAFTRGLAEAAPFYAALLSTGHPYWTERSGLASLGQTLLRLELEQNRPLLLAAMRAFDEAEFGRLLRAVIAWSVRGLVVGGTGGGTTERAYAEAAVLVSVGVAECTDAVFDALSSTVPADDAFEQAFAQRRVNRTTLARYYLVALAQQEADIADPLVVSADVDRRFRLGAVIPRRAPAEAFPAFPADELAQEALRLGNQYVTTNGHRAPVGETLPQDPDGGEWRPEDIAARQGLLAEKAITVWPRRP